MSAEWDKVQETARWAVTRYQQARVSPSQLYVAWQKAVTGFMSRRVKDYRYQYEPRGHGLPLLDFSERTTHNLQFDNTRESVEHGFLMVTEDGNRLFHASTGADGIHGDRLCLRDVRYSPYKDAQTALTEAKSLTIERVAVTSLTECLGRKRVREDGRPAYGLDFNTIPEPVDQFCDRILRFVDDRTTR